MDKGNNKQRRYAPVYEKIIPIILFILGILILVVIVIILLVAFGLIPGAG